MVCTIAKFQFPLTSNTTYMTLLEELVRSDAKAEPETTLTPGL